MASDTRSPRRSASAPSRRPGRPRSSVKEDKREALLLAALEAFGDLGFDGVSLSQIAGKAGSDIALTRYYFGSKEALWQASIDYLAHRLGTDLLQLVDEEERTATEHLQEVIRWFIQISATWPQLSRLIVFEGNSEGPRGRYVAEHLVRPFYDLMADLIKGAQAEGSIRDISLRTLFFLITHGGSFPMALPVLTNAFPGGDITRPRALKAHTEALLQLIFTNGQN